MTQSSKSESLEPSLKSRLGLWTWYSMSEFTTTHLPLLISPSSRFYLILAGYSYFLSFWVSSLLFSCFSSLFWLLLITSLSWTFIPSSFSLACSILFWFLISLSALCAFLLASLSVFSSPSISFFSSLSFFILSFASWACSMSLFDCLFCPTS